MLISERPPDPDAFSVHFQEQSHILHAFKMIDLKAENVPF